MSTTGKEYKLAIRIAGIIDKSFTTSLAAAKSTLKTTVASIDKEFVTLDKGYDKIMKAGKKCFDVIATAAGVATVAVAAATAGAITVGTEFETAFAGVKKTVDATEDEYAKLRQDILDMTREIPSAGTEIAGVMEVAGQLGISKGSLTDFTETMINLGVSTTMSAEDAATAIAKFKNIVQMDDYGEDGISNYERLGSVIVDLGNNMATTEEDIVNMATRLASYGEMAGLTEAQIMGISAALSSVGIGQEAGGSSMGRVLMQMQQAVAESTGDLEVYAKTAGYTVSEFQELFRGDAAGALISFISGLGTAGEDAYGILADLDLNTIRVRQALLSLAGGGDLLSDAIGLADKAWEENTALAIEAGKRYETTESKLQIMKNAFEELGIVAYEDLRDPFNDAIGSITDGVHNLTDYVGGPDGISKWIKNISTELPTLQRKVKQTAGPVLDFFEPLLDIGKWFLKNPKTIISALAGIGSALVAYKTASNLSHFVKSLTSLSSTGLAIAGLTAAIGLLVGAYTAYKQKEQDMIDQNLADHFGSITLSMEDLQTVAEHIIDSNSLGAVREALAAFEDLEGMSSAMDEAISEINKLNWKVSIGMGLTEDEQESYKEAIESYVNAAQEYALQSQYAVYLNLATTTIDEKDLESSNIVEKINGFYSDKYDELSALGTKLNEAVTEAFTDGLLEFDEMEKIAEIQAQMAAIEEALATGEFDAQMSLLGMDFKGGDLSADSFMNLQTELGKQVEDATAAYKESYVKNVSAAQAAFEGGALTIEEYYSEIARYEEQYLSNIGSLQEKAASFKLDTLMDVYGPGIEAVFEKYNGLSGESLYKAIMGDEDFASTRGAIKELMDLMEPTIEQVEQLARKYVDAGETVPLALQEIINKYTILKDIAENGTGFSLADLPGNNYIPIDLYDGLDAAMDHYRKSGNIFGSLNIQLSEDAASASNSLIYDLEKNVVDPSCSELYDVTQNALDANFAKPFDVNADVNILLDPSISFFDKLVGDIQNRATELEMGFINHRANGGLATSPELTWFAENGPEMAIPIDGSQNAISLWEQTGRLLGMDSVIDGLDFSGGTGPTIEYSPTLQFYGDAPSKEDLTDALRVSQDEFEALMERYMRTHSRVSFG